jgi:hypothetical protein
VEFNDFDFRSAAMVGGFFVAGFAAVWIFLTLRQGEGKDSARNEDRKDEETT